MDEFSLDENINLGTFDESMEFTVQNVNHSTDQTVKNKKGFRYFRDENGDNFIDFTKTPLNTAKYSLAMIYILVHVETKSVSQLSKDLM
ncbi:MAG: hypothetical protein LBC39_03590 [Methanobrevibacter sp.]|jgi:hypothetical protein|nr:hypothetical protein [Candidatus Methanovirga aequatorialis]